MLKFNALTTAVRIKKLDETTKGTVNENGFPVENWVDIIDEDILCEWKNKFGKEIYKAAAINIKQPASVRLWSIPGIDETCRIVRSGDEAIFDIVSIDDIENRHQQLEIELKRFVEG